MSSTPPVQPIAELIERSLNIRHIYGEPVTQGDTTVIPVAQVAYGFGAGGGGARAKSDSARVVDGQGQSPDAFGSGGGGAVRMTPLGVLEIGPNGTRFLRYRPLAPWLLAAALGLTVGWLLGRRLS